MAICLLSDELSSGRQISIMWNVYQMYIIFIYNIYEYNQYFNSLLKGGMILFLGFNHLKI